MADKGKGQEKEIDTRFGQFLFSFMIGVLASLILNAATRPKGGV